MPLKVAFIGHSYIESASRGKLVHLAQFTDLRLITPSKFPMAYRWYSLDFEFNPGVQVLSYPIDFLHLRRTSTRWFFRTSDLGLAQLQPDIIHVENEQHSWIVCQTLLYRKRFAPRAKFVLFSWENLRAGEQGSKAWALERLARFNRQFVDFFICGNADGKQILVENGVPEDKVEVLPQFGVDPEMFYPYPAERRGLLRNGLGISPNEFVVGFIGRFVEEKGLLDLVEATSQLKTAAERVPILLLNGKGNMESIVRARCAQLGVRLLVLPALKYHEIANTMNALDVLVLPSQSRRFWKEQFGHVLIEAMASGVPVIGSDSGEIPNVIGSAGLVFHEGDRENLFQCLRLCCDNDHFRLGLRERGLERVAKNYTDKRIADRTLQIYERIICPDHSTYAESGSFRTPN